MAPEEERSNALLNGLALCVVGAILYYYYRHYAAATTPAPATKTPPAPVTKTTPAPITESPPPAAVTKQTTDAIAGKVFVCYDASDGQTIDGQTEVRRWRRSPKDDAKPAPVLTDSSWDLLPVPANPSKVVRRAVGDKPGVYVPAGAMLATADKASLINKAIFLVTTMHAAPATGACRTLLATRRGGATAGAIMLRLDSDATRPEGPFVTLVDRSGAGWSGSGFLTPWYPPLDTVTVWAFQYEQLGPDLHLKRLPHSDPGAAGVEAITAPNTVAPQTYTNELTLGGWRAGTADSGGADYGNCTVHELVISSVPLTDGEMQSVYAALRARWVTLPPCVPYVPERPSATATIAGKVFLHYDGGDRANILTSALRPLAREADAVRRWRPCEGPSPQAESPWDLQSVPSEVPYRVVAGTRPGVYIPAGSLMTTGASVSLVNRAVFVVVTLQSPADGAGATAVRTVITNRRGDDLGTVMLRSNCSPTEPRGPFATYGRVESGWSAWTFGDAQAYPPLEQTTVWAFQYEQRGPDLVVTRLPQGAPTAEARTYPATALPAAYTNELTLGGYRTALNPLRGVDAGGEHGNLVVHEVIVSAGVLTDAQMERVGADLRTRWQL